MARIWKAHAYGNDFLCVSVQDVSALDRADATLARRLCARRTGIGADGLILFAPDRDATTMRLLNSDGSPSEVSGNGVRCLGAILAQEQQLGAGSAVRIRTDAGLKTLTLLERHDGKHVFRAEMGRVEELRHVTVEAGGEVFDAATLRVGNPQCVILASELSDARLHRIGPALQHHPLFPAGVNVELAQVVTPEHVRILIWERGAGPTESSGTGSCASAVAAAAFGGSSRSVDVEAPGGTQRVEWHSDDTIVLTGWAEVLLRGDTPIEP